MAGLIDEDELIEHWTLVGEELELLRGRTGIKPWSQEIQGSLTEWP